MAPRARSNDAVGCTTFRANRTPAGAKLLKLRPRAAFMTNTELQRLTQAFHDRIAAFVATESNRRARMLIATMLAGTPSAAAPPKLARTGGKRSRVAEEIEKLRSLMEADPGKNWTLEKLSKIAGASTFYLSRSFRQVVGTPFHRLLTNLRISRAQSLLKQGQRPSRVWRECGFADHAHMTRTFRARTGQPPSAFTR